MASAVPPPVGLSSPADMVAYPPADSLISVRGAASSALRYGIVRMPTPSRFQRSPEYGAALGWNCCVGKNRELLWYGSSDGKRFKNKPQLRDYFNQRGKDVPNWFTFKVEDVPSSCEQLSDSDEGDEEEEEGENDIEEGENGQIREALGARVTHATLVGGSATLAAGGSTTPTSYPNSNSLPSPSPSSRLVAGTPTATPVRTSTETKFAPDFEKLWNWLQHTKGWREEQLSSGKVGYRGPRRSNSEILLLATRTQVIAHVGNDLSLRRAFEENDWSSDTPKASPPFCSPPQSKRKARTNQCAGPKPGMTAAPVAPAAAPLPEPTDTLAVGGTTASRGGRQLAQQTEALLQELHRLFMFITNEASFIPTREGFMNPVTKEMVPAGKLEHHIRSSPDLLERFLAWSADGSEESASKPGEREGKVSEEEGAATLPADGVVGSESDEREPEESEGEESHDFEPEGATQLDDPGEAEPDVGAGGATCGGGLGTDGVEDDDDDGDDEGAEHREGGNKGAGHERGTETEATASHGTFGEWVSAEDEACDGAGEGVGGRRYVSSPAPAHVAGDTDANACDSRREFQAKGEREGERNAQLAHERGALCSSGGEAGIKDSASDRRKRGEEICVHNRRGASREARLRRESVGKTESACGRQSRRRTLPPRGSGEKDKKGLPKVKDVWEFMQSEEKWRFCASSKLEKWRHVEGTDEESTSIHQDELPRYVMDDPGLRSRFFSWLRDRGDNVEACTEREPEEQNIGVGFGAECTGDRKDSAADSESDEGEAAVEGATQLEGSQQGQEPLLAEEDGDVDMNPLQAPEKVLVADGRGRGRSAEASRAGKAATPITRTPGSARKCRLPRQERDQLPPPPSLRDAWDFMRIKKGYRFRGKTHDVWNPEDSSQPVMNQDQLSGYIDDNPALREEFDEWVKFDPLLAMGSPTCERSTRKYPVTDASSRARRGSSRASGNQEKASGSAIKTRGDGPKAAGSNPARASRMTSEAAGVIQPVRRRRSRGKAVVVEGSSGGETSDVPRTPRRDKADKHAAANRRGASASQGRRSKAGSGTRGRRRREQSSAPAKLPGRKRSGKGKVEKKGVRANGGSSGARGAAGGAKRGSGRGAASRRGVHAEERNVVDAAGVDEEDMDGEEVEEQVEEVDKGEFCVGALKPVVIWDFLKSREGWNYRKGGLRSTWIYHRPDWPGKGGELLKDFCEEMDQLAYVVEGDPRLLGRLREFCTGGDETEEVGTEEAEVKGPRDLEEDADGSEDESEGESESSGDLSDEEEEEEEEEEEDPEVEACRERLKLLHGFSASHVRPQFVWRYLNQKHGWRYTNGRELCNWVYIRPGAPTDGQRPKDYYFEDQEQLVRFVDADPLLSEGLKDYYVESRTRRDSSAGGRPAKRKYSDGSDCAESQPGGRKALPGENSSSTGSDLRAGQEDQISHPPAGPSENESSMTRTAIVLSGGAKKRALEQEASREVPRPAEGVPPPDESSGLSIERSRARSQRGERPEAGSGPGGQASVAGAGMPKGKKRGKRSPLAPHAGSDLAASDATGLNPVLNKLGSVCSPSEESRRHAAPGGKVKKKGSVAVSKEDGEEFIEPPQMLGRKVCSVCLGPGGGKGSDIFLECRTAKCGTKVHKSCYPVDLRTIDGQKRRFLCNICRQDPGKASTLGCSICRLKHGGLAMIPVLDGGYAHVLCFKKAVPKAEDHKYFVSGKFSAPVGVSEALDRVARRRIKPCFVCERQGGVTTRCLRSGCKTRFHPLCGALHAAQLQEEKGRETGLGVDITILCETHMLQASGDCLKCGESGTSDEMVACCHCNSHYHKGCYEPPIVGEGDVGRRGKWVCNDCEGAMALRHAGEMSEGDDDEESEEEENIDYLVQEGEEEADEEEGAEKMNVDRAALMVADGNAGSARSKPRGKRKGGGESETVVKVGRKRKLPHGESGDVMPSGAAIVHRGGRAKARKAVPHRSKAARRAAAARARELEAMWSSCSDGGDEVDLGSDGMEDDDPMEDHEATTGTSLANGGGGSCSNKKPRTEAFSAVPVGAQAYFNSQAGVSTLAVVPGGVSSSAAGSGSVAGGGGNGSGAAVKSTTRVLRKRGWRSRNRYTAVAKGDRISDEREARKRTREARKDGNTVEEEEEEEEEDEEDDVPGDSGNGEDGESVFGAVPPGLEHLLKETQAPVRDRLDALLVRHCRKFPQWKAEMEWGWNLLFYGVGSKLELLGRFEEWLDKEEGGGAVVGFDGFAAYASVRSLLNSLCDEVLGLRNMELSCSYLPRYARHFVDAFRRLSAGDEVGERPCAVSTAAVHTSVSGFCSGVVRGGPSGPEKTSYEQEFLELGRGRRRSSIGGKRDGVDRSLLPACTNLTAGRLFLIISNIDGEELRDEESQEALAELAASPLIHLAASVDHVNASLLWDVRMTDKFQWAWQKTHTYAPYVEEVRHRQTGTAVDDMVHSISSIKRVMSAWTPRHIDVMVELAKSLRRASEAGGKNKVLFRDLLAGLKRSLSATTPQALDGLLIELRDHKVVVDEGLGTDTRFLSISGGPEVIRYLAELRG